MITLQDDYSAMPCKLDADAVMPIVTGYLKTDDAKQVDLGDWDVNVNDQDVSCHPGWRVSVGDWGHVDGCWSAICAVKLVYIWYGR